MAGGAEGEDAGNTYNPYLVVTANFHSARTEVKPDSEDPVFDDVLYLPINAPDDAQTVSLEVWHRVSTTMLRGDKFLGRVTVPVQQLLSVQGEVHLVVNEALSGGSASGWLSAELLLDVSVATREAGKQPQTLLACPDGPASSAEAASAPAVAPAEAEAKADVAGGTDGAEPAAAMPAVEGSDGKKPPQCCSVC